MSEQSLFLLAVKNVIGSGPRTLASGTRYSEFSGFSSLDMAEVYTQWMPNYIDALIGDLGYYIPAHLASTKADIKANLEMYRDLAGWEDGLAEKLCVNTIYDNSRGQMHLWAYQFNPTNGNTIIACETMNIHLSFRLADDIVILHHSKKSWFGKKKWTETKRIPAVVRAADFVNSLVIVISPLLDTRVSVSKPSHLTNHLVESANAMPYFTPSDVSRRTIYDPILGMNIVTEDPELLKLIPTKTEVVECQTYQAAY